MQNPTTPENTVEASAPSRLEVVKAERSKARAACVASRLKAEEDRRRAERWARAFPKGEPPRPLYIPRAERQSARAVLRGLAPSVPVSGAALQHEAERLQAAKDRRAEKRRLADAEKNQARRAKAARIEEEAREKRLAKQAARFTEREEERRQNLLSLGPEAMRRAAETLRLIETGKLPGIVPKGVTSAELLQIADRRERGLS